MDSHGLLPGDGPLELDVGFGRGMSIFARLERAPTARIVAVEIKTKLAFQVAERVKRLGLPNVCVWSNDVRELLPRLRPDGAFDRAYIHFPDPWWKKRHRKRRVVDPDVAGELARVIRQGGDLYVQTDVEDRAMDYVEVIRADGRFALQGADGFIEANPFGSVSNREKRAAEDGLPVWRIHAVRT